MSVDPYGHSASHAALTGLGVDDHLQYYGDGLGRPLKRDGRLIVPDTRSPNNLIRNGGFEDSDTALPWWWLIPAGGRWGIQSHPITTDDNHRGGTNNLYHDLPGTANQGYAYALHTNYAGDDMDVVQNSPVTDAIQCAPGDRFRLSCWVGVRGTGWAGSGTAARINFYDKLGTFLSGAQGPYTSPEYAGSGLATRLECIGVAPATAAYVAPGVIIHTDTYSSSGADFAAAFHYDDFVLTYQGEDWRNVGATGEPGFLNGWVNYGGNHAPLAFRRTGSGDVQLRGLIKGGTGRDIFVLPSGYIPAYNQIFVHKRSASVDELRVNGTPSVNPGMVYSYSGYDAAWMSLAGIYFTPEG